MCGIAGFVSFQHEASAATVRLMTQPLSHRGPDGSGEYVSGNAALGHRRLAIIDVAGGVQPMVSGDGQVAVTFNGEIYNYLELREELACLGHRFETKSDTEVLIHGYREWGEEFQSKLNGMWAFALWDAGRKRMLLSRDRLGEKPLYYSLTRDGFFFASEPKSILACGISAEPEYAVLELYLTLGYLPPPFTFFRNIRKLAAGCYLLVEESGRRVAEKRYWDLPAVPEGEMLRNAAYVRKSFEVLFRDSVRLRMRSDVTFGAFLSGGLDSSSIVSVMSDFSDRPARTFTIGFRYSDLDERLLARAVAERFGTMHEERVVDCPSITAALEQVLRHTDEPFGDSSAIPTGRVSEHASAHVKMVLSGDGGDEVLSGYNAYQSERLAALLRPVPAGAVKVAAAMLRRTGSVLGAGRPCAAAARIAMLSKVPFQKRLLEKAAWAPLAMVRSLLADMPAQIRLDDYLADFYRSCPWRDPFYQLMYFHLKVSLPEHMLVKVDRMSMAHSLEVRTPFLDHRLVEFMVGVHKDVKLRGFERKAILRDTIAARLPKPLLRARKRGFVAPMKYWLADPAVRELIRRTFRSGASPLRHEVADAVLDSHVAGEADHGNFLWMTMMLATWAAKAPRFAAAQHS